MVRVEYQTNSAEETEQLGYQFGNDLRGHSIICFFGDLASGKTTFIQGLARAFTTSHPSHVSSPTFTYLNIYEGSRTVYHFDLYRLNSNEDFFNLGFEDYLYADGICCIEWSERIISLLPPERIDIHLNHLPSGGRSIVIVEELRKV
jgi:tRNA threonylcarbamoyladenosine biosynthesis protein TsaE